MRNKFKPDYVGCCDLLVQLIFVCGLLAWWLEHSVNDFQDQGFQSLLAYLALFHSKDRTAPTPGQISWIYSTCHKLTERM